MDFPRGGDWLSSGTREHVVVGEALEGPGRSPF